VPRQAEIPIRLLIVPRKEKATNKRHKEDKLSYLEVSSADGLVHGFAQPSPEILENQGKERMKKRTLASRRCLRKLGCY
jgi:hypothetical protein